MKLLTNNIQKRQEMFETFLTNLGLNFEFVGEVPAKGAAYCTIEMQEVVRVNIRCGYSRHNYAPCYELKIAQFSC